MGTDEVRLIMEVGDVTVTVEMPPSAAALEIAEQWWGRVTGALAGPYLGRVLSEEETLRDILNGRSVNE